VLLARKGVASRVSEHVITLLCAVSITGIMTLGLFLSLFTYGFFGQIFSYLTLLLLVLVVVMSLLGRPSKREDVGGIYVDALLLGLLIFGVYSSWYVIAAVCTIPLIGFFVLHRDKLRATWKSVVLILALPIVVCAYLTYIYLFTSTDGAGHVLTTGAVVRIDWWWLFISLPVLPLIFQHYKQRQWGDFMLISTALSATILAVVIGAYQYLKIHHLDYYFFKSTYTAVLLLVVCYARYVFARSYRDDLTKLSSFDKSKNNLIYLCAWMLVGVIVMCIMYASPITNYYRADNYFVGPNERKQQFGLLFDESIYSNYSDLIFAGSCNEYENFKGTIWSGSMFLGYEKSRGQLESGMIHDDKSTLTHRIDDYAERKGTPIALSVIGRCYTKQIGHLNAQNIKIIDPNNFAKQKT
jgi:hypothetical protein